MLQQINLIAPPRYVMTTTTLERTEGLSVLNQAMTAIKERIEEKRGVFNIQMEVRADGWLTDISRQKLGYRNVQLGKTIKYLYYLQLGNQSVCWKLVKMFRNLPMCCRKKPKVT